MIAVSIIDALNIVLKLLGRDNLHILAVQRLIRTDFYTIITNTLHLSMNDFVFTIKKRKGVIHAILYTIWLFFYAFTIGLTLLLGLHGTSHICGIHTTLYVLHTHGHNSLTVNSHVDSSVTIINKSLLVGNKRHLFLFTILLSQRIGVTFIESHHAIHVVCSSL